MPLVGTLVGVDLVDPCDHVLIQQPRLRRVPGQVIGRPGDPSTDHLGAPAAGQAVGRPSTSEWASLAKPVANSADGPEVAAAAASSA